MGQGRLTHIVTHTILTSFSTFSRGKIEKCDLFKEIKNETVAYSVLPKQARYQLRYTRLWNCFVCGLSCGLGRFLTNGFAELVPASGSVPAGCGVELFHSWMGGVCSQSRRATNCATPGYSVFLHDTTQEKKKQVFRVCGRRCGQARFCGEIFRRGISAASYCPKDFRPFAFWGMDRSSILPK